MEGGVGAYSRELAYALANQGHSVFIYTDKRADSAREHGIRVMAEVRDWNWAALVSARRWAQTYELDIVNLQYEAAAYGTAPFIHLIPSRFTDVPLVTTFHDLLVPYLFPKAGALRYQAVLNLARTVQGVIVTNPADAAQLNQEKGIAPLREIPIGSNIRPMPPQGYHRTIWRENLDIPADAYLVGYFGFLNVTKGVDTLIRAFNTLVKQGENAYLLLIGGRSGDSDASNARHADEVDDLIARLHLRTRIRRTGFVPDDAVSGHLLACDVLALPYTDGLSLRRGSLMAGLVHGCAIISTLPKTPLVEVLHGQNLYLVPPDSPEALGAALRQLAHDTDLRAKLGAGAKKLSELFTWDRIASRTAEFFTEILHTKS
ncbi:MAG: glycosyltransferase family 4 protein [Anaerolineae bacterium]